MTDDRRERELLSRARRGLSPAPADAARIRQGVLAALAAAVPQTASPGAAPDAGDVAPPADAASAVPVGAKLAVLSAIGLAAGFGYVAGHHAGVDEGRLQVPAPVITVVSASAPLMPVQPPAPPVSALP